MVIDALGIHLNTTCGTSAFFAVSTCGSAYAEEQYGIIPEKMNSRYAEPTSNKITCPYCGTRQLIPDTERCARCDGNLNARVT